MHAATRSPKRTPSEAAARPTSCKRWTAAPAASNARGVQEFPDKQATVAEVAKWIRTGELPARLSC